MDKIKDMLSVEELQEMVDVRKTIDKLLLRYNELMGRHTGMAAMGASAPAEPQTKAPESPAPVVETKAPEPPKPTEEKKAPAPVEEKKAPAPPPVVEKKPAPVEEKKAVPVEEKQTAPEPEKKDEPPKADVPAAAPAAGGMTNAEKVRAILTAAGKPLSFEEVYTALEKSEYELPATKPKLVIRKVLYNPANSFHINKGKFDLVG